MWQGQHAKPNIAASSIQIQFCLLSSYVGIVSEMFIAFHNIQVFERFGIVISDEMHKDLFARYDTSGNGLINYREFAARVIPRK